MALLSQIWEVGIGVFTDLGPRLIREFIYKYAIIYPKIIMGDFTI